MEVIYDLLRFFHVISFVFMCILLFNLIVANERVLVGLSFNYEADRHLEKIIKSGFNWCYVFQSGIFITGLLLLLTGGLGIEGLWRDWIVITKTIILIILMGAITYVQFILQPKIQSFLADLSTDSEIPDTLLLRLKPYRIIRKWMTSFYLFFIIAAIVLGIQVYQTFNPLVTIILISIAAIFSLLADKILLRFGWI
ncbi:MAG: hypothetical protein HKP17_14510 [Ignavibacteriaceae bacterium]|nr:hypothetical protein [Ignavibacteria bacterium]NNJ54379.1 hypothetical protein [Ignavibacteriaceae bacterium]NNL21691.1 hypothetical protein [Ignavibacteriaceae bacterium]